jgi:hypothetical protein
VFFRVLFRCVFVVFSGMQVMSMGHLRVVRRLFVIASFVVLCGLVMVLGRLFMVVGSLRVMLVNFVIIHRFSPGSLCGTPKIAKLDDTFATKVIG